MPGSFFAIPFNPFTLYFDAEQEKWMAISLLPIMPNFSYRITF